MRYFLVILFLTAVVVVSLAGFRGCTSRRPPLEIFADMVRQPKLRPQSPNAFFADNRSSRLSPAGTAALGSPFAETPVNTGRESGTTNFVATNPLSINAEFLARGQERFQIYCLPCHGALGDGKGITGKYGMIGVATFHDPRLVKMPDGEIFNTVSVGKNLMPAYGALVTVTDRWAITAYIRTLERSRLGTREDLPANSLPSLEK
jgi:hypothetical protein